MDLCPNCNSATVEHGLGDAHCLTCGKRIRYDGELSNVQVVDVPSPADSSLATPTATPVYAEDALTRQPVVDTNQEPVPTDVAPGIQEKAAPDLEAVNVAGELSDETPEEKKHGGPSDQPRTADLTATGKPKRSTKVKHSEEDVVMGEDITEESNQEIVEADAKAAKAAEKKEKKS